ncbi:hypothetical protein [Thalassotalea euphylliae]|uniref:Cytochrome c domain-containing protein n=1 Tax=Thalassotalea euphylliae TaxID=1655234 RepID=A0A3E0UEY6_9GAMM|nr:hypothetical protein [Thalassotalea euphylliae]REL35591.1 hypothetical protein DXX92_09625 [Thalassotalea euphylliae]
MKFGHTFLKTAIAGILSTAALLGSLNAYADHKADHKNQQTQLSFDESSFSCLAKMTPVRGFFVDNLLPNKLKDTVAIAEQGQGTYPAGSVVQLVPSEVMIKHPKGTNPTTNDWEFIELAVSAEGNQFTARGFDDVKNKFGGNCLDCHKKAKPEFDLICETGHGCDPIPITRPMIDVIQKTDPRCEDKPQLTADELVILKQLKAMLGGA